MLRATALVHDYPGARRALAGLDLELAPGELVCLLGPNGSGKSTLLRLLAGLLVPSAGRVELDGRAPALEPPRERARRVAFVTPAAGGPVDLEVQAFVLGGRYAQRSRLDNWWGRASRRDLEVVARSLGEADVADLAGRRLDQLSAGQLQRVRIARALAQEADWLFLDEPTSALDPEHQVRVFLLIERLVAAGKSALVATHELSLAGRFAQRCLLLDAGRLVASGAPFDVLRPEVLAPVFGRHLHYARSPGSEARPLVVPWPAEEPLHDGPQAPGESRAPSR